MSKISVPTKISYGIGAVGEAVKSSGFSMFLFFFYQQVLGLSGTLTGVAVLIALIFDAVTDPLAGSISDNWRSPRGRRHPFMYAAAVPLAVFWLFLFIPPDGLGQVGLFVWLTTFAILVRGAMTLYHVPHMALGAELSSDYHERTSIVTYRVLFGFLGGIMVIVAGLRIFFPKTPEFENGMLNMAGYPKFAVFGSLLMLATIWYSAWGTRKQIPNLPQAPEPGQSFSVKRLGREFASAWKNISFRSLFIASAVYGIYIGILIALLTHIYVFFWEFSTKQISVIWAIYAIGFLIGGVFSAGLHRRFDKLPTIVTANTVSVVAVSSPIALRLLGFFPENGSVFLFPSVGGFTFVWAFVAAIGFVSAGSMMADVAEEHEHETEQSQQGIFFSATAFSGKLSSGLGTFFAGIGIDLIDFPVKSEPSSIPPETIRNLGLFDISIFIFAVVGIYSFSFYRIRKKSLEALR